MADEPTTPQDQPAPENPTPEPQPPVPALPTTDEPFFTASTEDELNAKLAEAQASERSRVLKELGYEDLDSLKADTEAHRQRTEDEKTDEQRTTERTTELETQNSTYAERIFELELRDAIRDAGVPKEAVADVVLLVQDSVDVDKDGNLTGLDERLSGLQERMPALFAGQAEGAVQQRAAPDTTPRQAMPTDWWSLSPEEFQRQQDQVLNGGSILPR